MENPKAYGVAEMDGEARVVRIVEKPKEPKSNLAVIGIYFYDGKVFDIVKKLKPSARNELEITDVNNAYIETGEMTSDTVKGFWADAGENIDFLSESVNTVVQPERIRKRSRKNWNDEIRMTNQIRMTNDQNRGHSSFGFRHSSFLCSRHFRRRFMRISRLAAQMPRNIRVYSWIKLRHR